MIFPTQTYREFFDVVDADGELIAADGEILATFWRNGVSTLIEPTVASISTGKYMFAVTGFSGYTAGDTIHGTVAFVADGEPGSINLPARIVQAELATATALATAQGDITSILEDTGTTLPGTLATAQTSLNTLTTRITSTLFTGITSLAEWLGLMAGKQTGNSTARTELRATGAGSGTFLETTDSLEAAADATSGAGSATIAKQNEILAKINPVRVVAVNPVAEDGSIEIVEGDDYSTSDTNRALQWSSTDEDLTGATVAFEVCPTADYDAGTGTFTSIGTGSVTAYSGGINTIKVSLTAAETGALATSPTLEKHHYTYRLKITLSTRVRTPFLGTMTVKRGA